MKPALRFALGCGVALLLGMAGYWLAMAEPLQALANEEQNGVRLRQTVDEARHIARQQERLTSLNQRLRRAAGANAVDTAPRSSATTLTEISQRLTAAGGTISGIYPQEAGRACGFRVLVPPAQTVELLRAVEQTLKWRIESLELARTDDGRMELYLLLELGR